jgi:hypothetical protein
MATASSKKLATRLLDPSVVVEVVVIVDGVVVGTSSPPAFRMTASKAFNLNVAVAALSLKAIAHKKGERKTRNEIQIFTGVNRFQSHPTL